MAALYSALAGTLFDFGLFTAEMLGGRPSLVAARLLVFTRSI